MWHEDRDRESAKDSESSTAWECVSALRKARHPLITLCRLYLQEWRSGATWSQRAVLTHSSTTSPYPSHTTTLSPARSTTTQSSTIRALKRTIILQTTSIPLESPLSLSLSVQSSINVSSKHTHSHAQSFLPDSHVFVCFCMCVCLGHVITEGFVFLTSKWARLYFFVFHLSMVVFLVK